MSKVRDVQRSFPYRCHAPRKLRQLLKTTVFAILAVLTWRVTRVTFRGSAKPALAGPALASFPRDQKLQNPCEWTKELNCSRDGVKHIGLLLTKDDGKILYTWLSQNSYHFSELLVLDGSKESYTRNALSGCERVKYYHENEFTSLKQFSDGELRELGHRLVSKHFGYDIWITMAHTDEFYVHSPKAVAEHAQAEGADHVKWRALHVLPHPSEYNLYLRNPDTPAPELFRHYHHYGPKGSFTEYRTFFSSRKLFWQRKQGEIIPQTNLKRVATILPSYLHYKVHNLSTSAYTLEGIHKQHWNHVTRSAYSKPNYKTGVGIRWRVSTTRDFFVSKWPGSSKYTHVSRFDGTIEHYLDIGKKFMRRRSEEGC